MYDSIWSICFSSPIVFDPNSGSSKFQSQVFKWPPQCLVQGLYVWWYLCLQHVAQPWPSLGGQQKRLPKFEWANSAHWNLRSSDSQINHLSQRRYRLSQLQYVLALSCRGKNITCGFCLGTASHDFVLQVAKGPASHPSVLRSNFRILETIFLH